MGSVKTDAPFYQAAFNSRLAEKLIEHGYAIRPTATDFELTNVSRELIEKFSKRHAKIKELEVALEDELEQSAVTWSKKSGINYDKALGKVKAELGKKSREPKSTAILKDQELRQNWRDRMTPAELESLQIDKVKGPSEGFIEAEVAKELTIESLEEVIMRPIGLKETPSESVVRALSPIGDNPESRPRELHIAAALLRKGIGRVTISDAKTWASTTRLGLKSLLSKAKVSVSELIHKALKSVRMPRMPFAMVQGTRSQTRRREQSIGMER
jgi:TrwC relaxase